MTQQVAFITGSAKRIGACTARTLHQAGFNIVLHCNHSRDEATRLMQALNQTRPDSTALVTGDLCQFEQLQQIAEKAQAAFGRLDVLVNNASSFYPTPVGTISLQDWQSLVGSNMQAPLFLSQYCRDQLVKNSGAIINMVDIHAEKPLKDHTVYCMAKAALVAMTKSLAQELAPEVRVNGVAPGAILWPDSGLSDEAKAAVLEHIPVGRLGDVQDIADTILFLVRAPYVSGQIIAVDGGRSIASASKA